jgi:DNA-3-methyladenine glycosylase I
LDVRYHDTEWGVPLHDDRGLFEFLILEGAQAGLSWATILQKRENYRRAFDRFDAAKIARYDKRKVRKLLADAGIVRNRLKIAAAITNAPGVSGRARGVRQLRPLRLVVRRRNAEEEFLANVAAGPGANA